MSEYIAIVKAIDKMSEAQALQTQGILKCVEANAIVTNKDLSDIKTHLKEMNGTVAELKRLSDARALVVDEFHDHQKFGKWVHKNWWVVLLIFIVSVTFVVILYDTIGWRKAFELIFTKI